MVWAIRILCVSLSCDPVPEVAGWFFDEADCQVALRDIDRSWRPSMGIYELSCYPRLEV